MAENRYMHVSQLVKIPTPHFAVFYNGKIKRPEVESSYPGEIPAG